MRAGRVANASVAALVALLIANMANAGAPSPRPDTGSPPPPNEVASLGSFRFESGEIIDNLKVSYNTHGKLSAARDNALLALHGFASDHHTYEVLIGPGKLLDPGKYFIIAPDFLANAKLREDLTTGPTNSGLKMHFPRITAHDWVNADYKLVKEYLGIEHVMAIIGASVGGIKALQFAVSYPNFASAIVPIVPTAQTNPQARMVLRHVRDVIALDPGWYGGMYDVNPTTGLKVALMELVPWLRSLQWNMDALTTTDKVRSYQTLWQGLWSGLDARDIYYGLDGWSEFNIGDTPGFNGDPKAALAAIKAKTLLIGVREDQLFRSQELEFAKSAIRDATYLDISSPHGHIAVIVDPEFWKIANAGITTFLETIK
jgi:homoserine O-acetyltransferase/O-succinyltransferase